MNERGTEELQRAATQGAEVEEPIKDSSTEKARESGQPSLQTAEGYKPATGNYWTFSLEGDPIQKL